MQLLFAIIWGRTLAFIAFWRGQATSAVSANIIWDRARVKIRLAIFSSVRWITSANVILGPLRHHTVASIAARTRRARISGDLAKLTLKTGLAATREILVNNFALVRTRAHSDRTAGGVVVAWRAQTWVDEAIWAISTVTEFGQASTIIVVDKIVTNAVVFAWIRLTFVYGDVTEFACKKGCLKTIKF